MGVWLFAIFTLAAAARADALVSLEPARAHATVLGRIPSPASGPSSRIVRSDRIAAMAFLRHRQGGITVQPTNQQAVAPRRALRLTFAYEGGEIRLTDVRDLEKQVRPSAPLPDREDDKGRAGFWVELQTGDGKPLYRQVMNNPVRFHAEVPDGKGGFTNRPIPQPRGVFFVIVPELPDADQVVIFSSPLGPEAKPAAAAPVARFPLRRKGGPGAGQGVRP